MEQDESMEILYGIYDLIHPEAPAEQGAYFGSFHEAQDWLVQNRFTLAPGRYFVCLLVEQ